MSATTKKRQAGKKAKGKARKGRKARGFFQAEGTTDLVIPMVLEDRLALRYLQVRTGQPTPQKTVMGLIKSMIMAMRLEDELKAKEAQNDEQYTNTAGEVVDPGTFAADVAGDGAVPAEAIPVIDSLGDLDAALTCDDGSRADGN